MSLLSTAEAIWWSSTVKSVVAIDDFGDGLDGPAAARLASVLGTSVSQAWLSTRRSEVVRTFDVQEIVRLTGTSADRAAHQIPKPTDKTTRGAMRHFQLQLLPAMTARAVIVCEGQHDVASLREVAHRLERLDGTAPPLEYRIELVDGGGKDSMWKVADLARRFGFHTVGFLDWDRDDDDAKQTLERLQKSCDCVVRLPLSFAIERALMHGVADAHLASTLNEIREAFELKIPKAPEGDRDALEKHAFSHILKAGSGGLHQAYVSALPEGIVPSSIAAALAKLTDAAQHQRKGFVQL